MFIADDKIGEAKLLGQLWLLDCVLQMHYGPLGLTINPVIAKIFFILCLYKTSHHLYTLTLESRFSKPLQCISTVLVSCSIAISGSESWSFRCWGRTLNTSLVRQIHTTTKGLVACYMYMFLTHEKLHLNQIAHDMLLLTHPFCDVTF